MNKSKKIAIGLLSTIGITALITIPIVFLSSQSNIMVVNDSKAYEQRYKIASWLKKTNKDLELFSYFFKTSQILKKDLLFIEDNFNKIKIYDFFNLNLFLIFKYSTDDYKLNLKINYLVDKDSASCILKINWYFVDKKINFIFKNIKYYDILKLYFL